MAFPREEDETRGLCRDESIRLHQVFGGTDRALNGRAADLYGSHSEKAHSHSRFHPNGHRRQRSSATREESDTEERSVVSSATAKRSKDIRGGRHRLHHSSSRRSLYASVSQDLSSALTLGALDKSDKKHDNTEKETETNPTPQNHIRATPSRKTSRRARGSHSRRALDSSEPDASRTLRPHSRRGHASMSQISKYDKKGLMDASSQSASSAPRQSAARRERSRSRAESRRSSSRKRRTASVEHQKAESKKEKSSQRKPNHLMRAKTMSAPNPATRSRSERRLKETLNKKGGESAMDTSAQSASSSHFQSTRRRAHSRTGSRNLRNRRAASVENRQQPHDARSNQPQAKHISSRPRRHQSLRIEPGRPADSETRMKLPVSPSHNRQSKQSSRRQKSHDVTDASGNAKARQRSVKEHKSPRTDRPKRSPAGQSMRDSHQSEPRSHNVSETAKGASELDERHDANIDDLAYTAKSKSAAGIAAIAAGDLVHSKRSAENGKPHVSQSAATPRIRRSSAHSKEKRNVKVKHRTSIHSEGKARPHRDAVHRTESCGSSGKPSVRNTRDRRSTSTTSVRKRAKEGHAKSKKHTPSRRSSKGNVPEDDWTQDFCVVDGETGDHDSNDFGDGGFVVAAEAGFQAHTHDSDLSSSESGQCESESFLGSSRQHNGVRNRSDGNFKGGSEEEEVEEESDDKSSFADFTSSVDESNDSFGMNNDDSMGEVLQFDPTQIGMVQRVKQVASDKKEYDIDGHHGKIGEILDPVSSLQNFSKSAPLFSLFDHMDNVDGDETERTDVGEDDHLLSPVSTVSHRRKALFRRRGKDENQSQEDEEDNDSEEDRHDFISPATLGYEDHLKTPKERKSIAQKASNYLHRIMNASTNEVADVDDDRSQASNRSMSSFSRRKSFTRLFSSKRLSGGKKDKGNLLKDSDSSIDSNEGADDAFLYNNS